MDKFDLSACVSGAYLPSGKFKTEKLSLYFYLPLDKATVAPLCLLTALLPDGCERLPRPMDISRECDRLFGASVTSEAAKLGNVLMLHFSVIHLSDRFAAAETAKDARQLLQDIIFNPSFSQENFENEKRLQLDEIDALINDKRAYVRSKCNQAMFEDDDFGIILPGSREQMEAVSLDHVKAAWQDMLSSAYVHISHTAPNMDRSVFDGIVQSLSAYDRQKASVPEIVKPLTFRTEVQRIEDKLPIAQGKLVLGFKTKTGGSDADTYKMMVMCDIFGGGTYSLLFSNVREKMSLCYYCAARANRRKGVVTVDSGVEFENMDKTEQAVLDQLDRLKQGDLPDGVLASSKRALCQSLESICDSQTVLDRWYADRLFDSKVLSPEQLKEKINSVTAQDVADMASSLVLDTVYKLAEA